MKKIIFGLVIITTIVLGAMMPRATITLTDKNIMASMIVKSHQKKDKEPLSEYFNIKF